MEGLDLPLVPLCSLPLRLVLSPVQSVANRALFGAGVIDMTSISLFVSQKVFLSRFTISDSFAEYSSLCWELWSLSTWSEAALDLMN